MELKKELWTEDDIPEFQAYLKSFGRPEKEAWAQNIINTKMPTLAITTPNFNAIIKGIASGNFISFIDLWIWEYYENTTVIGFLLPKIKDFEVYKKYLRKYAENADNWATCDLLKFNVNDKNKADYFALAKEFIGSDKPFKRRIGIDILFPFITDDNYIGSIFEILNGFEDEKEYYVNMVNAWLIAECFVKQRDKTLAFLESATLNPFTANKAVSKCRDSFRVSAEDKEMLLKFRKKREI